jgi:ribosome-binding ATPase YchF (GTP1/OBG family)
MWAKWPYRSRAWLNSPRSPARKEIIPARMNFVDIAGLVEGASQGEGLGNKFLANIRETDAIIYVLRCFDNDDITHVRGTIDPVADFRSGRDRADAGRPRKPREAQAERDQESQFRRQGSQGPGGADRPGACNELKEGRPARRADVPKDDRKAWNMLQLLTSKPILFVANVDEASAATGNDYSKRVSKNAPRKKAQAVLSSQLRSSPSWQYSTSRTGPSSWKRWVWKSPA